MPGLRRSGSAASAPADAPAKFDGLDHAALTQKSRREAGVCCCCGADQKCSGNPRNRQPGEGVWAVADIDAVAEGGYAKVANVTQVRYLVNTKKKVAAAQAASNPSPVAATALAAQPVVAPDDAGKMLFVIRRPLRGLHRGRPGFRFMRHLFADAQTLPPQSVLLHTTSRPGTCTGS